MIVLWISEAIPIPIGGLLGIALIVLIGVAPADDVIAPFGSTTILVFIGAFIIAQAMLANGLARRFAFRVLAIPGVGKSTTRMIIAFGAITCLLSAFVSNTATVAMLLPTAIAILGTVANIIEEKHGQRGLRPAQAARRRRADADARLRRERRRPAHAGRQPAEPDRPRADRGGHRRAHLFRGVDRRRAPDLRRSCSSRCAWSSCCSTGPRSSDWKASRSTWPPSARKLGPLSRKEKNTLIAFGVAVTLWIAPGFVAIIAGDESKTYEDVTDRLDEGVVAVLAASLLFFLPNNWEKREFTLTWNEAKKIDWGTILLFGSGIVFGAMLQDTGLAETIGKSSADTFGVDSELTITIFAVMLAILISETTSNTASAAVVVPIVIPIAVAAGVDPFVPALAATFAASFGFMLPVSTPQNAIVYGSGMVPITQMVRNGFVFDVIGAILIVIGVPVMVSVLGIGG